MLNVTKDEEMRKVIILKLRHFIHRIVKNSFLFKNERNYNSIKLILLRF